ncbi:unnamed protein product, partial [Coccothraustes coccothraustes]
GELSLRHGSCSLSFSGHFNFTAHLLCTSIMFKASMEVTSWLSSAASARQRKGLAAAGSRFQRFHPGA